MPPLQADRSLIEHQRLEYEVVEEGGDALDGAADERVFLLVPGLQKVQKGGQICPVRPQKAVVVHVLRLAHRGGCARIMEVIDTPAIEMPAYMGGNANILAGADSGFSPDAGEN